MNKILSVSLIFFLFTSCNIKEKLQEFSKKLEIINSDLRKEFKHKNIFTNINWGTEEDNNYIVVSFFEFDMDSKNNSELKKLADKVVERLILKNPNFKNKNFSEVLFTNEIQSEEITSFTKFRVNFSE